MKLRLFGLLAAAALAAACSSPAASSSGPGTSGSAPNPEAFSVTDALGRTVTFAAPPTRIAIAGKASFFVADAVFMFPEASARVVALPKANQGDTDFISAIDPAYSRKTILDGSAGAEQIAAAHPDCVILKSSSADTIGKPLEAIGVKVVYVDFETPEQYARDLGTLGRLFGDPARAQELIGYFATQRSRVEAAVAGLGDGPKPRVLMLYYSSKNGTVAWQVPPLGFIQSTEALSAGGDLVWSGAQLGSGWTTVSLEQIAVWNPDQVYVIAYFDDVSGVVARLKADPQWQKLKAVAADAVFGFPGDFYSWDEPDPRWALGLTWLAVHVHPAIAPDFDMSKEVRQFYATLYGMSEATFEAQVQPHLPAGIG